MNEILKRDISGECAGECRDRVKEGEFERQFEINASGVKSPDSFPGVRAACARSEAPGFLGGHV